MKKSFNGILLVLCWLMTSYEGLGETSKSPAISAKNQSDIDNILRTYTFIGDFNTKEETRNISDEIFWRYPLFPPKTDFPIIFDIDDPNSEMPRTPGDGRAVDHLNRGRVLFLEKKYTEAKNTWLSGRARYGKEYRFHRRTDYFIGCAFLQLSRELMTTKGLPIDDVEIRSSLSNAATFLSWAFIVKADQADEVVDRMAPKGLYNLAAIYWQYDRFAGAYGAAESGLNFLRKSGRKEFRPKFNRILAESFIRNRTYLEAIQSLDQSIRQDPIPEEAAASFARAGDVYFDLNNYELAEDTYHNASKIYDHLGRISPPHLVLYGESLFWLGKFSESQKILSFALEGPSYRQEQAKLPDEFVPWASLRIADGYLARHDIEKARLEYYKVGHTFRSHLAGKIAKIREACLDLPFYGGKNVDHARGLLEESKTTADIPNPLKEMAWACQVASYTERERTPEMLDRVRIFAEAHPESRFLKTFFEPVRSFQADQIYSYFRSGDQFKAIAFFEKNRKLLFPSVDEKLARRLFVAYADTSNPKGASEFWSPYQKDEDSDINVIRSVTIAAEMADIEKTSKIWVKRNVDLSKILSNRRWKAKRHPITQNYVTRLRSSPSARLHNPWLLNLIQTWDGDDHKILCDIEYPILASLYDSGGEQQKRAAKRVREILTKQFPKMLSQDESCGLSLLELEAKLYDQDLPTLAKLYLQRKDWPFSEAFRHLFWTLSERLYEKGQKNLARAMWNEIITRAPPKSEEARYVKSRLDPTSTEFEQLWNN